MKIIIYLLIVYHFLVIVVHHLLIHYLKNLLFHFLHLVLLFLLGYLYHAIWFQRIQIKLILHEQFTIYFKLYISF